MGNQGMTNWKFSAFLAIALILIAGLFSNTAMAAANDGQGSITLTRAQGAASGFFDDRDTDNQILFANEAGYTLTFMYTVSGTAAIDMNGGLVQIKIPSGWIVPHAMVTAGDSGPLFPTDSTAEGAQDAEGDTETNKRIVLTKSGDNVTYVGIKLDAGWTVPAGGTVSLTITMAGVTSATPSSLFVPQTGRAYDEEVFRTRSMAKGGDLRPLVIGDDGANPQPRIRVGNVKSGSGQVDVSPIVYETETDRNIELIFTAAGPMYDTADVNAQITITAPTGLTAPQITDPAGAGFMTVSRQSGTVLFARPNKKIDDPNGGQTITIDITRMEANAKIYVAYSKVAPDTGAQAGRFTAQSAGGVGGLTSIPEANIKPEDNHLQALFGSGTITLMDRSDNVVAMGSRPTLTFTFKAAVGLGTDGQTLRIDQPSGNWAALGLQSGNPRGENYVSVSTGTLDLNAGNIIVTAVKLTKNASMTVTIARAEVNAVNGSYVWDTMLAGTTLAAGSPSLLVASDAKESVTFSIIEMPDTEVNHATASLLISLPHYPAASKQNIRFRFKTTTPIKGGYVKFSIPSTAGWVQPSLTDVKGKATVKLVSWNADNSTETLVTPAADADMTLAVSGNQITVNIKEFVPIATADSIADSITVQYGTGTGDFQGMVQNRAQADLEILGRFKSGVSTRDFPAAAPVSVRIGNVAAGSGTAMITSPSSHTVKAGSKSNNITIVYRAAGTMDGGSVRLHSPDDWGALQETDSSADNYIRVNASSSMVDQNEISYGTRYVLVPLKSVGASQSISFIFNNVKAQKGLGLAKFTVESAGGPSDDLVQLLGIARPADKDDADAKEDDEYLLLGQVYQTHVTDTVNDEDDMTRDGVVRLKVIAGDGGTGEVELVEVNRSDEGLRNYLNEDGDALELVRQVHAGDSEVYLVFKYAPVETIEDGELRFTVPDDWSTPQDESSTQLGYTSLRLSAGAPVYGTPVFENRVLTLPLISVDSDDTIEIHYGSGSLGAEAPKVKKTSDFGFSVKGTSGSFVNIGAVKVEVRSQASGRGEASVDTGMADEDGNATVHAGDTGSITITYTSIGQIVNGRVKLTVPAALTGGADGAGVTASHISVSGNAKYGGALTAAQLALDANADVTKDDILVSNVNLRADGTVTFTYEGAIPEITQDLSFTVALDGGEGPGEVDEGMVTPAQVGDALTVTVLEAAAGSGMVSIAPMASVAAGSVVDEITVTYTAIGQIDADKVITVTVPGDWAPPLADAAAPEKMGTFTVMHLLKLADDAAADAEPDEGDAVDCKCNESGRCG